MRKFALVIVLAAATAVNGVAQQPVVSIALRGPRIHEVAPDFEAPDQHGVPRRLSALLGTKGAMLVFYRSAEW